MIEIGTLILYFNKNTGRSYLNRYTKEGWTGFILIREG